MIITEETKNFVIDIEKKLINEFKKIDDLVLENSIIVNNAFHDNKVSEIHFNSTTGYGYDDIGRDTIEAVFAQVLGAEDALVRNQLISGSHALNVTLFSILRPGDTMLSISGLPYDTLHEVIGIKAHQISSKSFLINYTQLNLTIYDFNFEQLKNKYSNNNY